MKKIRLIVITMLLAFIMTGCARINIDINVKSNGKVDMEMLYAMMEDYADESDMLSDKEIKKMEDEGWKYSKYSQDGYVGYTISVKDKDLKEITDEVGDEEGALGLGNDAFSITKDGSNYIFDALLLDEDDATQMAAYKTYFNLYGGYMKLVLHVPEKAVSSNATSVSEDGKTLTWDLLDMAPGEKLHAEFKISAVNIKLILGLVAAAIVVCAVVLVMKNRGKKDNNGNIEVVQTSSTGAAFCPQCGAKLEPGTAFCPKCGKQL